MRVSAEIEMAEADCAPETRAALENAAARIADYHARQKPEDSRFTMRSGLSWANVGRRSMRRVFMFQAGWQIILLPC